MKNPRDELDSLLAYELKDLIKVGIPQKSASDLYINIIEVVINNF